MASTSGSSPQHDELMNFQIKFVERFQKMIADICDFLFFGFLRIAPQSRRVQKTCAQKEKKKTRREGSADPIRMYFTSPRAAAPGLVPRRASVRTFVVSAFSEGSF